MVEPFPSPKNHPRYQGARCHLRARSGRRGEMLTPRLRYRNVRADVLDILQKISGDGEVVGWNGPRGRFGPQKCGRGRRSNVTFFRPLLDLLAPSQLFLAVTGVKRPPPRSSGCSVNRGYNSVKTPTTFRCRTFLAQKWEIPREISFFCLPGGISSGDLLKRMSKQKKECLRRMSNEDNARFPYLKRMSTKKRMFKKTKKAYLAGNFLGIHFLLKNIPFLG